MWPDIITHLRDSVIATNNSEILREASLEVTVYFLISCFFSYSFLRDLCKVLLEQNLFMALSISSYKSRIP